MKGVIDAIFGILMLVCVGSAFGPTYRYVQITTLKRVHKGLEPLAPFTRALTGYKENF